MHPFKNTEQNLYTPLLLRINIYSDSIISKI